jgi:uncharacterized membrane protein YhaH (DUF805 family)
MDFLESIKTCFSKYVTFEGRARRSEYWWFALAIFIASCIPVVQIIVGIATILPSIAVGVRRLHDTGRSGWWLLLCLVPIVSLVLIYFLAQDSQPGNNQYGANPKA